MVIAFQEANYPYCALSNCNVGYLKTHLCRSIHTVHNRIACFNWIVFYYPPFKLGVINRSQPNSNANTNEFRHPWLHECVNASSGVQSNPNASNGRHTGG